MIVISSKKFTWEEDTILKFIEAFDSFKEEKDQSWWYESNKYFLMEIEEYWRDVL